MDNIGGLLLLGLLWLLFNFLGRGRSPSEGPPRPPAGRRQPRTLPPSPDASRGDATQREGSRLERLLRELEEGLDQVEARSRAPAEPLPEAEDVEERTSLEQPPQVISLETEVVRRERPVYDRDSEAEAVVRRRIAAAEARSGAHTMADHKAFDQRIRQEPADHTAVRRFTPAQLRDAVVWREILGPPVSERES